MTPPLWQKTNRKERVSLINVKEVSEKAGLKLNKNEDHGIWSHHFMANSWGNNGNSERLYFEGGSKITGDGDGSHKIKRHLLLGRKVITNLDSIFKSRITLLTKVRLVKAMVFPVVMYGCKSWTIKKAECQRIDAFELRCWRRLLRVLGLQGEQTSQS